MQDRKTGAQHLETAHLLADVSAKAILPKFRRGIGVENKAGPGNFDPVTEADKAAERVIRRTLKARHPDHAVLGEEYGHAAGTSPYTWVIDPIDGTKAFIIGAPLWGTLIGLLHEGTAEIGMMNQPFTRERIWSEPGKAKARWRVGDGPAKVIATRSCPQIKDAILGSTSPDLFQRGAEMEGFAAVKSAVRMTRFGGDCYGYCLLAAGHIDLVIECGLKPHDVVALIPIIEAAGGRITTWTGERAEGGGRIVAAGDPRLHEATLKMLAKYR